MSAPTSTPLRPAGARGEHRGGGSDSRQRSLIYKETISNTALTAVLAMLITWLIFRGQSSISVFTDPPGGIFGVIPGTFNFTLLVTLALTLVTRRRVRRGGVPPLSARGVSPSASLLPGNVFARAIVMALAMSLIFISATYGLVWELVRHSLVPSQWSMSGMLLLFTVHFTLLALLVTPVVVWRALLD